MNTLSKCLLAMIVAPCLVHAQTAAPTQRVESNVVYGMYSGLALLMDVYHPGKPNGYAIVAIEGSGYYSPMRYDATALNSNSEVVRHAQRFAAAGYTVFAINHRQAPRFRYPAAVEDAQRAVRFIRFNAAKYAIAADRIGAWGSSSGGHLAELLGTVDGKGDAGDSDPINRLSAKVQTIVAVAAPSDLPSLAATSSRTSATVASFMGFAYQDPTLGPPGLTRPDEYENKQYRDASPVTHVSSDDAPTLLIHGDEDTVVPIKQSETMTNALKQVGVDVSFIKIPGGKHGPNFQYPVGGPRLPDYAGAAVSWFDSHLKSR